MTLGRLTIFCDCSLSTSLAHLSTTVLGQAFMCVAAATLALEGLVGMDGWTKKQRSRGGSWVACGLRLFDGPLSEDRDCAPGRCWASLAPGKCYCLGRSRFLLNLVDIARLRPARPDKLELWR